MTVLSHREILSAKRTGLIDIDPWSESRIGPSSVFLHLGSQFARLDPHASVKVDVAGTYPAMKPVEPDPEGYVDLERGQVLFATTAEKIGLSNSLAGIISGTSDLARLGVQPVLSDFVAPGFGVKGPGVIVLEIVSHAVRLVRLRPGMRIAHLILLQGDGASDRGYDDVPDGYAGASTILSSRLYKRLDL